MSSNKQHIIDTLQLRPHVEGGYFRRTYESPLTTEIGGPNGARPLMSSICYLLTDDSPIGYLHRNRSDIVHYFHCGSAIRYHIVRPDGTLDQVILGDDLADGHAFQLVVPGGCWKASELLSGEFGLLSEAVSPGFDYNDMEMASEATLREEYPSLWPVLQRFVNESELGCLRGDLSRRLVAESPIAIGMPEI